MRKLALSAALVCAVGLAASGPALAQKKPVKAAPPSAPALPKRTPDEIMARYIEATGGRAAYDRMKTLTMKITLTLPGLNLSGDGEVVYKSPDKFYIRQTIASVGDSVQAFDGKTGWINDPIQGLRKMEPKELAAARAQSAASNAPQKWKEDFKTVKSLGARKAGGKMLYALAFTLKEGGDPIVQYFDPKTFLLERLEMTIESPQGTLKTVTTMSDYRDVEGIKMSFRQKVSLSMAEFEVRATEVKVNAEVPDSLFAMPAAKK